MDNATLAAALRGCAKNGACPASCPEISGKGKGDCIRRLMLAAADALEKKDSAWAEWEAAFSG